MVAEIVNYTDGGHADRTATLERDGDSATLVVGTQRVPLDINTRDPGGSILKGVTTNIAVAAYALLGLFKQWNRSYGDRIAFEVDGRKIIGLYQEHPPDKGKNYPHPGVTLLEPTGQSSAPPGAPGPVLPQQNESPEPSAAGGASAANWAIALGVAGVGLVLFGAAISGVGLSGPKTTQKMFALRRSERLIDRRYTGNYRVELVDLGDTGEEYVLRVTLLGPWASGDAVDVHVSDLDTYLMDYIDYGELDRIDVAAKQWFRDYVLGDHDVALYLERDGYDHSTNRRR